METINNSGDTMELKAETHSAISVCIAKREKGKLLASKSFTVYGSTVEEVYKLLTDLVRNTSNVSTK